eukprot:TRINITY_DN52219_c0_g1_i1.p1 TRINITY_DN52219_c0_g1~~TRINITY_DN52219_c0_g1_i1.p1  ORF type:complete len:229 (+),score=27.43 TRINITY_DN52219_c0_g1_i1:80-766(+)
MGCACTSANVAPSVCTEVVDVANVSVAIRVTPTIDIAPEGGVAVIRPDGVVESWLLPAAPPPYPSPTLSDSNEAEVEVPLAVTVRSTKSPTRAISAGKGEKMENFDEHHIPADIENVDSLEAVVSPPIACNRGMPPTEKVVTSYSFVMTGNQHSKEGNGYCMLCLEQLPNDPREVINLCAASPRCLCLLHRRCFLNPEYEMNDQFRKCMICKGRADIELVRLALRARK